MSFSQSRQVAKTHRDNDQASPWDFKGAPLVIDVIDKVYEPPHPPVEIQLSNHERGALTQGPENKLQSPI